jgi:hypothetical protein
MKRSLLSSGVCRTTQENTLGGERERERIRIRIKIRIRIGIRNSMKVIARWKEREKMTTAAKRREESERIAERKEKRYFYNYFT